MIRKYDYLIVGAGLAGSVFAYEAAKRGRSCLVLEKRAHVGGNLYGVERDSIPIHLYGPHIFHTSSEKIWNFVTSFTTFYPFINTPMANYHGEIYNLPFNMNTFSRLWGVSHPEEAKSIIREQSAGISGIPGNVEEQALKLVGRDIYEKLVKGYTEKQWGRPCSELPAFIIKRLPVRFVYDNRYFNDPFQGVPKHGYNEMFDKLLASCEVRLQTDFLADKHAYRAMADKIVYTGMLDAYFDYCYGCLEYRSLRFETYRLEEENHQGVAVMNYTDAETPYTRIVEHKHFTGGKQPYTYLTKEYPIEWRRGEEPYYPINDEKNQRLYQRYRSLADNEPGVLFLGRLAEYRYYNMDQVTARALWFAEHEFRDGGGSHGG